MVLCVCALLVCLAASMIVNFKLIDELEKADKKLEELEDERVW